MKSFLQKLVGFAVFSVALNVALLLLVVLLNRLAVDTCHLEDDITAVIIGDSHTMWSIDSSEIDNLQNISFNAEGYIYTYYKLKHLLGTERNISHVYLGFGYHNLAGYYDDYISGSLAKHFMPRYIGVLPISDFFHVVLRNTGDFSDIFRRILSIGGRSGLKQQCSLYGRFPDERQMETFDASQMKKRIQEQYYYDDGVVRVSKSNLEYLNKIVSLLRNNDIEVTLLNTPLHRDYLASIPAEYKDLYRNFITENNLNVYEFEDLVLADSQFLPDGDHVNYEGAMLTTLKLKEYLEAAHD